MQFRASFFNVSGFLAPGIVSLLAILWLFPGLLVGLPSISGAKDTAPSLIFGSMLIVCLLASSYLLGLFFSELFMWFIGRAKSVRNEQSQKDYFDELISLGNLDSEEIHGDSAHSRSLLRLCRESAEFRQVYCYHDCGNIDIYAYAGRIRMLGASGLALVAATLAWVAIRLSCWVLRVAVSGLGLQQAGFAILVLFGLGVICIALAYSQSKRYERFVAEIALFRFFRESSRNPAASTDHPVAMDDSASPNTGTANESHS